MARTDERPLDARPDTLVDQQVRSHNLDILRALAALMVLFFHAYLLGVREINLPAEGAILSMRWLADVSSRFLSTGVWLFFGLSGYLISKPFIDKLINGEQLPPLVPYAIRRAARIYPLYWVTVTATIIILRLGPDDGAGYFPFHYGLVHNVIPKRQTAVLGVAWTLTLEVLFYLLVPIAAIVVARVCRGRPVRPSTLATLVGLTWLASVVWTALAATLDPGTTQAWARGLFPAMLGMFCPGILLAIGAHSLDGSRWRWWLKEFPYSVWAVPAAIVCLAAAAMLLMGIHYSGRVPGRTWFFLNDLSRPLFAVGYGLVLARAIRSRPWGGRLRGLLVELGLISYGIYLFHAVLFVAFDDRYPDFIPLHRGGAFAYVVHAIFLAGMTLPLAWVSWHYFERPILKRAVRFANRWDPAHATFGRPPT